MNQKRSTFSVVNQLKKFSNCYTFAKVMGSNPDLCKRVIERILEIEIKDIEMVIPEANLPRIEERGVRCDVLAYNSDSYFEVEMQTYTEPALGKRIHYLDSMVSTLSAEKGQAYNEMTDRVIIFICTYDPFSKGFTRYPFSLTCDRDHEIVLETGTAIQVINASTLEPDLSQDLENLLIYVQNGTVDESDTLVRDLNKAVAKAVRDESWVSFVDRYEMEIRAAEVRSERKGREEGIDIGRIQEINALMDEGILTPEQAAERIKRIQAEVA